MVEVSPDPVHLVDESDPGHAVPVGLTPYGLRLGFDPTDGTENSNGPIQNSERPFDFRREIHVPRGVDNIDAIIDIVSEPMRRRGGRRNRDPPLLLLLHPVHGGSAIMHLAHPMDPARIEQDPFGGRRLSGIDMGHDADITKQVKGGDPRHL
jgi:hypothetical protein